MNKMVAWINYIKQRIAKNKNFLCVITGPTGSGKSWAGLSIAEQLDPEFDISRCVFRGKDLMELINSGTLKKGSVIFFDESQIDLNNRAWQSLMNKLLNYLLTTFRHRCFVLIFTSPYIDFLDSSSLKLFHANFETVSINREKKTCSIKPKQLQYNQNLKRWYHKYLKASVGKKFSKIKRWHVRKPSAELIKQYEERKTIFTTMLNKQIEEKFSKLDGDGKVTKDKQETRIELNPFQAEIIRCWEKGIFEVKDIVKTIHAPHSSISISIAQLAKKGIYRQHYGYNAGFVAIPQAKSIYQLNSSPPLQTSKKQESIKAI